MAEQDSEHSIHVVLLPNQSQGHIKPILTVRQAPRRTPRRPVHTRRDPVRARPERRAVPGGRRRRPHRRNLRRLRPRRLRRGRRDRGVHGPAGVGRVGDRGRAPPVRSEAEEQGRPVCARWCTTRSCRGRSRWGGGTTPRARRSSRSRARWTWRTGTPGPGGWSRRSRALGEEEPLDLPGLRPADLPMFLTDPDDRGYLDLLVNQFGGLDTADHVLVNSIADRASQKPLAVDKQDPSTCATAH
ncbi:hypothetical protein BDA96_02G279400 [Sorghum bicolor]|uniref:Uncharacterized protein n=1 Tax=Sorghum bicolor TaxID=4558 RepID=A0A921RRK5_SORBI|nr:hypothetical protein BDA96_02G279400 [Sorghum bicolor]